MARMFLEGLIIGNIAAAEASQVIDATLGKLTSAWGVSNVWPGEEKDLRVVKIPAGATSVLVEGGPNPSNENSAVWVYYQVRLCHGLTGIYVCFTSVI
jgi:hypothetical protein